MPRIRCEAPLFKSLSSRLVASYLISLAGEGANSATLPRFISKLQPRARRHAWRELWLRSSRCWESREREGWRAALLKAFNNARAVHPNLEVDNCSAERSPLNIDERLITRLIPLTTRHLPVRNRTVVNGSLGPPPELSRTLR